VGVLLHRYRSLSASSAFGWTQPRSATRAQGWGEGGVVGRSTLSTAFVLVLSLGWCERPLRQSLGACTATLLLLASRSARAGRKGLTEDFRSSTTLSVADRHPRPGSEAHIRVAEKWDGRNAERLRRSPARKLAIGARAEAAAARAAGGLDPAASEPPKEITDITGWRLTAPCAQAQACAARASGRRALRATPGDVVSFETTDVSVAIPARRAQTGEALAPGRTRPRLDKPPEHGHPGGGR